MQWMNHLITMNQLPSPQQRQAHASSHWNAWTFASLPVRFNQKHREHPRVRHCYLRSLTAMYVFLVLDFLSAPCTVLQTWSRTSCATSVERGRLMQRTKTNRWTSIHTSDSRRDFQDEATGLPLMFLVMGEVLWICTFQSHGSRL